MRTTAAKTRPKSAAKPLKPAPKPLAAKSRRLDLVVASEAEVDRKVAEGVLSHYPAAIVAVDFGKGLAGEQSIMEVLALLRDKASAVNAGDLTQAEGLLMSQALALNTIFGELSRRAACNLGQYIEVADKYLRLALKAQEQCRATLETLAAIKNPPVLFAKQANIAHGPQQVNNGTPLPARTENATIAPNELLEAHTVTRLDTGATAATGGSDPALAPVGVFDRTAHG